MQSQTTHKIYGLEKLSILAKEITPTGWDANRVWRTYSRNSQRNCSQRTNYKQYSIARRDIQLFCKDQNVLPREVTYDVLTDEPIHVDFLRVVPGVKIRIEVPVEFINHEKSPGLKRGGVLNIVRRKVELKCPSEKIPEKITLDLDGIDIGESFKISSVKLESDVVPTIQGRDFVIATLAAPTVMKEPEKPAEAEAAEGGEEGANNTEAATTDGDKPAAEGDKKEGDEKKPADKKAAEPKK